MNLPALVQAIAEEVAAKHKITVRVLLGHDDRFGLYMARGELWTRLYDYRNDAGVQTFSSIRIGRLMDGRDHSTILRGIYKYRDESADAATYHAAALVTRRGVLLAKLARLAAEVDEAAAEVRDIEQELSGQSALPLERAA